MNALTTASPIDSSLVNDVYLAYQELMETCLNVKLSVEGDGQIYPVYVPTFSDSEDERTSIDARQAAINSITQMYLDIENNEIKHVGILCASPETVEVVELFNKAKSKFKQSILAIRKQSELNSGENKNINVLIQNGFRAGLLKEVMDVTGTNSLDLKRCYTNIRIMEKNLDIFCWTWTTTHSRTVKMSIQDVEQLIQKMPESMKKAQSVARDLLHKCNENETLIKKVPLPNQLRANYGFNLDGEIARKSCPISGVVIAQQEKMPRKLWRPNPIDSGSNQDKLPRLSKISSTPYIKSLNIYRYVK